MGSIKDNTSVEKVAVIGAGPSGLAAAKYLLAEKSFTKVVIFEQRLAVGGVWNATLGDTGGNISEVPHTRPSTAPTSLSKKTCLDGVSRQTQFVSAIYDDLETNIPHTLMRYSDLEFPKDTPLFPSHETVLSYIERYSAEIVSLIKFGVQVLNVGESNGEGGKGWCITTRNLETCFESTSKFDAVIVASGHYDDYYVPDITGIKEWNSIYQGSISHSKFYRRPDAYGKKKTLIVGNSASGIDIASQIGPFCKPPLLISSRSPTPADFPKPSCSTTELPEIKAFVSSDRSIHFTNGHVEKNIDCILFCTGYLYSFPFLTTVSPPLITDGIRTRNLYQQLFYYPNPTLSFLALPQRILPLPISEAQSAVVARFLAGRLSLPSLSAMKGWDSDLISRKGDGKKYHLLGFPHDADYNNFLHDWAVSAPKKAGLENCGKGKLPSYWGDKEKWLRERIPAVKSRYRTLGIERKSVMCVEDLGFHHEEEKGKQVEV